MRWKEILIGALIYGLVIFSGYGIPLFITFLKSHCAALIRISKAESVVWSYAARSIGL